MRLEHVDLSSAMYLTLDQLEPGDLALGLTVGAGQVERCGHRHFVLHDARGAVDSESEVLDMLIQSRRDRAAAARLMRKQLKNQGTTPTELVTNRLKAYGFATREFGLSADHILGKRKNNRAESSHVPIRLRERKMQGFRSPGSVQRFFAVHAAVANTFTTCRHLISAATHRQFRAEAFADWREAAELAA